MQALISSVVSAIATALIALFVYLKQRSRKEIIYAIDTNVRAFSVTGIDKQRLSIQLDGASVEPDSLHLVILQVFNSGNTDFRPADFVTPITFDFGVEASVVDAEVTAHQPASRQVDLVVAPQAVSIAPLVFNSGNMATIKILVQGESILEVKHNIVGIDAIKEVPTAVLQTKMVPWFVKYATIIALSWSILIPLLTLVAVSKVDKQLLTFSTVPDAILFLVIILTPIAVGFIYGLWILRKYGVVTGLLKR